MLFLVTAALALPVSAAARAQSQERPRLGASRLVLADGESAAGEPVWLFLDRAGDHRHSVSHPFWATTTSERGRFVLHTPHRGQIRHAADRNGGWANFEILGGSEGGPFWFWSFPAYWNGSAGRSSGAHCLAGFHRLSRARR